MRWDEVFQTALTLVLVVIVVSMVAGQLLGQPVLLGYVTTDSMEPTISPGDGFVAIPAFLVGPPQPGDVVVFQARTLHDGGLTTHRVVEETDNGYVTKGDNNPFTDQDGGEPPVTEGQVVAYALQVDGEVVTIPYLGTAISSLQAAVSAPFEAIGTERAGSVLVFVGIALFVLAGVAGEEHARERDRRRERDSVVSAPAVVAFAVVAVVAFATAAMVLPAGVTEFGLVATDQPTDDPQVVRPGTTTELEYTVHNAGAVPTLVVLEPASPGVGVGTGRTVLGYDERATTTVSVAAPDETGKYLRSVRESRYLLVLPPSVILALHRVHPLVALGAVDAVVGAFVLAAGVAVFGTGQLRLRTGHESRPLRTRLRRRLRKWR